MADRDRRFLVDWFETRKNVMLLNTKVGDRGRFVGTYGQQENIAADIARVSVARYDSW